MPTGVDEEDEDARGLLDHPLVTGSLWGFAGTALLMLAFLGGGHYFGATQGKLPCKTMAGSLPESVPKTTVLHIRAKNGNQLSPDVAPTVRNVTEEAVALLGFEDRFIVDVGRENRSSPPGAHVLPVAVLEDHNLREGIFSSLGKMCGNLLLWEYQGDEALDKRIFVHELGHFLGLCHEDGTWMIASADDGTQDTDRFSDRQLDVLGYWNEIGEPYIPHWQRNEAGDLECG